MAEKQAMIIKYKYLEYVKNANLSDADSWIFIKSLIEYDKTGKTPEYINPVLSGLFAVIKYELDENRVKWEEVAKVKSEAGKKGGAPKGNKNARKQTEQAKQADGCINKENKQNKQKQHDSGSVSDHDLVSSPSNKYINSGGGNNQPPPHILKNIKNESAKHGFFIDDKIAKLFFNSNINVSWLTGDYSFLEYCAVTVKIRYNEKENAELKPLYISAVTKWDDLRESYQQWEDEQKKAAAEILKKKMQKELFEKPPICECGHQTEKTYHDYSQCPECRKTYVYDWKKIKWENE